MYSMNESQNICGTICNINYWRYMEAQHWGLPNTSANVAQKSKGMRNNVGPIVYSPMC